jgi:hypothetical protein
MSRWVRLNTSYFTDSRTFALRSRYGETALWLVPRLWCFAAENAQDGCLSAYGTAALAEELRFTGDADGLFAALREVGYLDDACRLVDWAVVFALAKARTESAAKAREALAAKRAAHSSPSELGGAQDPSRRERRARDTVTVAVTARQQTSLAPPQYCELTEIQRTELASVLGSESAASAAYNEWRGRKLNFGDVFAAQDDAYLAALAEFRNRFKALAGAATLIAEVPGWHGFLRDRSRLLGQDPDTIPAEWGALTRDQQEVVQGQRARAALFVTRKQKAQ